MTATNLAAAVYVRAYSNASNARRAARAAGLSTFTLQPQPDGRVAVLSPVAVRRALPGRAAAVAAYLATRARRAKVRAYLATRAARQLAALVAAAPATVAVPVVADQPAIPAHKVFAAGYYHKSAVASPVAAVHAFMDANPDMSRKLAIFTMTRQGISYHTARTQVQVWRQRRAAAAVLAASGAPQPAAAPAA